MNQVVELYGGDVFTSFDNGISMVQVILPLNHQHVLMAMNAKISNTVQTWRIKTKSIFMIFEEQALMAKATLRSTDLKLPPESFASSDLTSSDEDEGVSFLSNNYSNFQKKINDPSISDMEDEEESVVHETVRTEQMKNTVKNKLNLNQLPALLSPASEPVRSISKNLRVPPGAEVQKEKV